MNPRTLRLIGIVGIVLTVLVALDGIYMLATNYKPDDTSGNALHLADGTNLLIAAGLLLIISIVAFVLSRQAARRGTPSDTIGVTPAATPGETSAVNDEIGTQDTARPEIQR
jgi:membrane protein implicated in regulation of membrane protease activity